jgi:uncharacterized membrane protein YccC
LPAAHFLTRMGFEPSRISFALWTSIAAAIALVAAWMSGLEHPQWSAMTVFAASQPVKSLLIEKSWFRALGTVVGAAMGVVLVIISGGEPVAVVLGLAVWIGVCTWAGNILRGFVSYGALLAGYTAAMVALLDTTHPDQIVALGIDRLFTVLTGVFTALVVGLVMAPARNKAAVVLQARKLMAVCLRNLANQNARDPVALRAILHDLAILNEALDQYGAGSFANRRAARDIRGIVSVLIAAIIWLKNTPPHTLTESETEGLKSAAEILESTAKARMTLVPLMEANSKLTSQPPLQEIIGNLEGTIRTWLGIDGSDKKIYGSLHKDWTGALQAAVRASASMIVLGALWVVTGWSAGPLLLLGTAIMASLYSTWENPALIMRDVLIGQVLGVCVASLCRWFVWPFATSALDMILMLIPFVVLSGATLAHRRTMLGATDYCMALLLLSQPIYPLSGDLGPWLERAIAVMAAPALTLVVFLTVFPADFSRRKLMMIEAMTRDLQALASSSGLVPDHQVWLSRLHHRLLRLVLWSTRTPHLDLKSEDGAFTIYAVGEAVFLLRHMQLDRALPTYLSRPVGVTLIRIGRLAESPLRAHRMLALLAARLDASNREGAETMRLAANMLIAHLEFFKHGRKRKQGRHHTAVV